MSISKDNIRHLLEEKRFEEAEEQANLLVGEDPVDVEAKELLGRSLYMQEKFADAADILQEAVSSNEESPNAILFLALSYEALERFDEAKENYEKLLIIQPNDTLAHYWLGNLHDNYKFKNRNVKRVRYHMMQAIQGEEPIEDAFIKLAYIDSKRAISILQKGLSSFPRSAKLCNSLAEAHLDSSDIQGCIRTVQDALKRDIERL